MKFNFFLLFICVLLSCRNETEPLVEKAKNSVKENAPKRRYKFFTNKKIEKLIALSNYDSLKVEKAKTDLANGILVYNPFANNQYYLYSRSKNLVDSLANLYNIKIKDFAVPTCLPNLVPKDTTYDFCMQTTVDSLGLQDIINNIFHYCDSINIFRKRNDTFSSKDCYVSFKESQPYVILNKSKKLKMDAYLAFKAKEFIKASKLQKIRKYNPKDLQLMMDVLVDTNGQAFVNEAYFYYNGVMDENSHFMFKKVVQLLKQEIENTKFQPSIFYGYKINHSLEYYINIYK